MIFIFINASFAFAQLENQYIPFDINKISQSIKDSYYLSQPASPGNCAIGSRSSWFGLTSEDITSSAIQYAEIQVPPGSPTLMRICRIAKTDRDAALKDLNKATGGLLAPKLQKINVSGYKMQVPIPCQPLAGGQCASPATPAGYIARIYQFGLMIVGFAAFAMIVYGGILYVFAAGDITKTSDAKDTITNAIYGLILFLGAYLILYTINPELVNLRNPQLEFLQIENLAPIPEPGEIAGLGSGAGSEDPLCDLAVNGSIGVSVSAGSLSSSGDRTASACVRCADNAAKDSSGRCICSYPFSEYGGTCISQNQCRSLNGTIAEKWAAGIGPTCVITEIPAKSTQ